jgi:hypothetical protein
MRTRSLLLAIMSFLYWAVRRLLELLVLFGRDERAKEVEILVLRHELQVLRRQVVWVPKTSTGVRPGLAVAYLCLPVVSRAREYQIALSFASVGSAVPDIEGWFSVALSFLYWALRRLLELLTLRLRSEQSKEIEILVLRHQLHVLGREIARPRLEPADRALLAALSRVLPRREWRSFLFRPRTLLC